ncbi:DNA-binding transcriptional regulator, GntR family [Carnobacterium iners]|uniref:DNA-binding transcriptional regulator, GntR family n=1 Tax=Carnobacterium iners TaxID=1073423 RepID=A0A1X7N7A6_9LACT|nr:GntR family transcriptional regulator [Carnobacterium iners]SEK47518.1 DNA-binding transcriptional regulator, GntR family [Carnobacterium iners]SMH33350.1 DNA-binding transcriptional regulator, GntR family [Carnobacterium iners]
MAKPKKLDELAYQYIKEKIDTRQWMPQTRITELGLSKELNISRTPIRQAFQQLQKEGFLEVEVYKGARVREQKIESRGAQERLEFIEMTLINYFHYLQIKEIIFDCSQVEEKLVFLKKHLNDSEKEFLNLEAQLIYKILVYNKNNYFVRLMMDTIREIQTQNNPEYLLLMKKNRDVKIAHYEKIVAYLKVGDHPLARKQVRILINQLTLNIIHNGQN